MRYMIIPFGECSVPVPPDVGGRYVHRSVAVAVFPWRLDGGGRHVHRSVAVAVCVAVTPGQRPLVGVLWSVEIS